MSASAAGSGIAVVPKIAPCEAACPAGIDVPRYVRQVREGRYDAALATIRERIPFPLVCGHACFHPCESKCGRAQFDAPVAIRMLKRVAAERGGDIPLPAPLEFTGRKVAIVGSGPCGLTAGYYLALLGHAVDVYEARDRSGGMLRHGIPAYRLDDAIVDADIRIIESAGVRIHTGQRVDAAEALLERGYDAAFVASGAWRATRVGIPGEETASVISGIAFLEAVNAGKPPSVGARVVVIGGGDTAIDAARAGRRLGAEVVQIYRRAREQMPASDEEIRAAIEEGVQVEFLVAPVAVAPGALRCVRMALGVADADGRPRPEPVAGTEFSLAADTVIVAVGQEVDAPLLEAAREASGAVRADAASLATPVRGLFAGGDAVTGPATIIDAIAQGRRASAAIDRFLGGDGDLERFARARPAALPPDSAPRGSSRETWQQEQATSRITSFALVEKAYEPAAAMREATRCLSCDLLAFDVQVNAAACKDCGYCDEVCRLDVFTRSDAFNAGGYHPYAAAHPERCIGCLRCLYICPDFAITISDRGVAGSAAAEWRGRNGESARSGASPALGPDSREAARL
jgi:NADPH-dependent glutamate synthase beta subunit-like oxidoreductase